MAQDGMGKRLGVMPESGCAEIGSRGWWTGQESDPVVASGRIVVAGAQMLIQTTKSGLMLLNGKVVEPAAKGVR